MGRYEASSSTYVLSSYEPDWVYRGVANTGGTAQTFTPQQGFVLTDVNLFGLRQGTPGPMTLAIHEVATAAIVSGRPTGTALLAASLTSATCLTWGETAAWHSVPFGSGISLTSGVQYSLVAFSSINVNGAEVHWLAVGDGTTVFATDVYYPGFEWTSVTYVGGLSAIVAQTVRSMLFETYSSTGGSNQLLPVTNLLPGNRTRSNKLVATAGDQIWYQSTTSTMAEITAARGTISADKPIDLIPAFQKVFVVNDLNMKVMDFTNSRCFTTDIGANPPDYTTILTGSGSNAQMVVDYITSLITQSYIYGAMVNSIPFLTTDTVTGTDDDGNAISFAAASVLATSSVPLWYDWTVYGGNTTFGTLPLRPGIGCLYRGRIVLAGKSYDDHQWEMARQGNPWDWNYISTDAQSPIAGNNADVGKVGDSVIAVIPRKDDFLIFGCANSMWMLRGDAAEGGSLDPLSLTTGIFGKKSWCWDDNDNLYWWGNSGIFRMNNQGVIENITKTTLPEIIKDFVPDPALHRITMGFDPINHGIVIAITKVSDGTNNNFWLDLRTLGIFPETYPTQAAIGCQLFFNADDDDYRKLLVGGNDGYIRYFDQSSKNDDSGDTDTAISSYVVLGPIPFNKEAGLEGKLLNSFVTLGGGASGGAMGDTDGLQLSYFTGDDAETVLEDIIDEATAFLTVVFTGTGRKIKIRTKMSGVYGAIKCSSVASGQTWAIENIVGEIKFTKSEV